MANAETLVKDGNKESTKELLGAFRTIGSANLSIVLVLATLAARTPNFIPFWGAIASTVLLLVSLGLCIWLFLLVIRKLALELDDIIDLPDVKATAALAFAAFILGCGVLLATLVCA